MEEIDPPVRDIDDLNPRNPDHPRRLNDKVRLGADIQAEIRERNSQTGELILESFDGRLFIGDEKDLRNPRRNGGLALATPGGGGWDAADMEMVWEADAGDFEEKPYDKGALPRVDQTTTYRFQEKFKAREAIQRPRGEVRAVVFSPMGIFSFQEGGGATMQVPNPLGGRDIVIDVEPPEEETPEPLQPAPSKWARFNPLALLKRLRD